MPDKKNKKPEVKDLSPKKDAKGGRASMAQGVGQVQGTQLQGTQLQGSQAQGVRQQGTPNKDA